MKTVKTRTFSGVVCEQKVFNVGNRVGLKEAKPRLRFRSEAERTAHKLLISKRKHAQQINENYSPSSIYSTLTLDNDYEVHTFGEAKRLRNAYVRRLQRAFPDARLHIYMGRGKNTARVHFHMISDGIPEDVIVGKWGMGTVVRTEHLKAHNYYDGVDHGQDYTGLANYLFDHWTEEQGGHHYKTTRNLRKPKQETATEVKRTYTKDKPPKAPKGYKLVAAEDNAFGYLYFKYVKEVATSKRRRKRE